MPDNILPEVLLKQAFDPFYNAPLEVWHSFVKRGDIIHAGKNEVLKHYNTVENYLYFILRGSGGIMLFHNKRFVCVDLCYEMDFFGDYFSFLTQQPSALEVVCFEASTLFRIDRKNFTEISETDFGKTICKNAAESLFIHKQVQQIDLLSKTAEERYRELLDNRPDIVLRTPGKHIASYLGITPESISRIRKSISQ